MSFNTHYKQMASALQFLLDETRKYADSVPLKIEGMQEIYLQKNSSLYSEKDLHDIRYYLKASMYKYHMATLALEQLWSLSHAKRDEVFSALDNSLDRLECSDDEIFLISFAFETFLFQGKAFLDFYTLYISLLLQTGHEGKISTDRFYKALDRAPLPFRSKATDVLNYFESKVFAESGRNWLSPENWGLLLQSLRDKIAHRDKLRPSYDSNETLVDSILFNWPTLRATTYDRFCQYMENGMFDLLHDLSKMLYEMEWEPGPSKAGWSNKGTS